MFSTENHDSATDSDIDAVIIDHDDVSNYNPEQILPQSPETIKKIRSWLRATQYAIAGGEYRKHLASFVAGTGDWLTSSDAYREWLQSTEKGLLWIRGIPGSGKSVMAAKLVDELAKSNPGSPVLFFFFRQIIEANHKPEALLRDWMDQVLACSPPLQQELKTYVKANRSIESLSMEDMWKNLRTAFVGLPGKVFCVADALDEMDHGNDAFLKALGALGRWRPETVKVLITSRPVPAIEGPLRRIPHLDFRLQDNLVDVDISIYVHFALAHSAVPQSQWQVIADAVPGRANGLFLYAKLAMDAFLEPGADVNAVLSQLPSDLNVLYTDLLKEHAQRSGVAAVIQHLILQAVTHATRPLRLIELAEMVRSISPDGTMRDLKAAKTLVRTACGPLLEILPDETVSVIHHSFTEYLKGRTRSVDDVGYPILLAGSTHAELALTCLRYLQAGCLNRANFRVETNDGDRRERGLREWPYITLGGPSSEIVVQLKLDYPFYDYAASNWKYHIVSSEAAGHDQTGVNAALAEFLGDKKNIEVWLQVKWHDDRSGHIDVTELHIAARFGLVSYTKMLLVTADLDAKDPCDKTPLWWAASEGHTEVVSVLVAAGAKPNEDAFDRGLTPLHEAADRNHDGVVKVLLEAGVDPLTPKTQENPGRRCGNSAVTMGHTPLMYACRNGHLEALEAFLPFLDTDAAHRALTWAAINGRSHLVARILQHPGVDVNEKVLGDTPLFRACQGSDSATIKILLNAGADPRIACESRGDEFAGGLVDNDYPSRVPSSYCLNALCAAITGRGGRRAMEVDDLQEIFSEFLRAGVDINQRDESGGTALHGAVCSADSAILTRLLLDSGADANATDNYGSTPLHQITSIDAMELLIEHGQANINLAQGDGRTPLLCILSRYNQEVMLKFLEYGPDCNATDRNGNGALHIVLDRVSPEKAITIEALLKRGADPNMKNYEGRSPLFTQFRGSSARILDLLLEAGADINAVDRSGMTLLFHLMHDDENERLSDLISRGASATIRDFNGRTILHQTVKKEDFMRWTHPTSKLKFLLGLGLDIHAVDYYGNGLLHELALRRENHDNYRRSKVVTFWEELLAMGLDLERKNHGGQTPLHILCANVTKLAGCQQEYATPIDVVISRTKQLDVTDNKGITPLHIAVTRKELYAKMLLDAGADPSICTYEGLTPLHLASRSRQSNIVGLLLGALSHRDNKMASTVPSTKPAIGVDAETYGRRECFTPLFFACRSGRPEIVALLLEAGADVKKGRIIQACLDFEGEDGLWTASRQLTHNDRGGEALLALELNDTSRCAPDELLSGTTRGTARIDEIPGLLTDYGVELASFRALALSSKKNAIDSAVECNRDYTAACLKGIRDRAQVEPATEREKTTAMQFWEQRSEAVNEMSIHALYNISRCESLDNNQELFQLLLARKEYFLVEQLARSGTSFLPIPRGDEKCHLAVLVSYGFASLVDKIGTLETESRLESGDWHAFGDSTRPGLWFARRDLSVKEPSGHNPMPFLLQALRRQLPNMSVVRLLVEKFGVHVDELHYTHRGYDSLDIASPTGSALHHAARGYSWWHVHQALPYLLRAGADVHVRTSDGQTPLLTALKTYENCGPYHNDAAKVLIEWGADIEAEDEQGYSCLARAVRSIDTTKLLIAHGATVTPDAIFSAINAKNVQVLEALLSRLDANTRRDSQHKQHRNTVNDLERHEEYPLYHAAWELRRSHNPMPEDIRTLETSMNVVQALLDHGADPFAKFLRLRDNVASIAGYRNTHFATPNMPPKTHNECTVLHELLLHGRITDNFLRLAGLDANHRDYQGRTVLHAACLGDIGSDYIIGSHKKDKNQNGGATVFQLLVAHGADIEARDDFGRNVLHHMLHGGRAIGFDLFKGSMAAVLEQAPTLINQQDEDGKTPLHYAICYAIQTRSAAVAWPLLNAGADPLIVDNQGNSVLHLLAHGLNTSALHDLFRDLVKRGVDINGRNALGETPLFAFASRPKESFNGDGTKYQDCASTNGFDMLRELGADLFVTNCKNQGLLHEAARESVTRFQHLMDSGLDAMLEDDAQQTAIDVAAACGNNEVLALFEKGN